jgi:SAM-dependent methyltransferase
MGVSAACHRFLLQAHQRNEFSGTLVTLGRQEIWITAEEFSSTARQLGSNLQASATPQHERLVQEQFSKNYMDDRSYFESLGFKDYKSLDADPYESADIIFDLSNAELPKELVETADVVIDIGVIEHCFNIPAALKNIFMLLKTGGRAILFNPTIQQVDASFYFFQPTLFYDYFKANRWRIDRICVYAFPHGKWHNDECNTIVEYEPGLFDLNAYGLDGRCRRVMCWNAGDAFSGILE